MTSAAGLARLAVLVLGACAGSPTNRETTVANHAPRTVECPPKDRGEIVVELPSSDQRPTPKPVASPPKDIATRDAVATIRERIAEFEECPR